MAVYDVFKSLGTESFIDMDNGAESSDCFCELCSLDFTTHRELEEHTWSILHNTNLNRKQGKDCIHPCSLCKEQFSGLLEFTSHLHGENHQEKLHNWQKDQHQEWSPEEEELHSPNKKQIQSPCHKGKDRSPPDLATDNLTSARDFQDSTGVHSEESAMDDNRWGSGHGRVSSRNIPSLLDNLPPVGYHYPEQLEMRRGSPPNQSWENERWEDERGYSNAGYPMWDGGQRETYREFRDGPWSNRVLEGMDDPRYHRNRDDDSYYSSRDSPGPYPIDHFSDGYGPSPRQRDSFEGDSGFRPRYDDYRPDLRDRITRRNGNSSHSTHNNAPQRMKSVVGTYSRGSRPEGRGRSSQRRTPHCREDKGRRTSLETTKRDSRDKSQRRNSPSSESPSGKSARKSKPRKLVRSEEKKKDDPNNGDAGTKGNELERKKREETAVREKGKGVSASSFRSVATDEKRKSTEDKSNMQPSYSGNEGTASSIKHVTDPKENTSSSSKSNTRSSSKRNSLSSVKGVPSPPGKKGSTSASKKDSSSPTKGNPSSPSRGAQPSGIKRNSASPSERDATSASKRDFSSSTPPSSTKEDSTSLAKGESSLAVKEDLSSSDKGDIYLSIKGDFLSTVKSNSSLTVLDESSLTIKEDSSSLSKESEASLARGGSSLPSLGGSSLITAEEKADTGKASTIQRDCLSSLKDKDKLTAVSSKRESELILPFREKETLGASLDDNMVLSQKEVDTLPVLSGKSKDMPLPKMGEVCLPSTGEKTGQTLSASLFSRDTSSLLGTNGKEKRVDNQAANISGESEQNNLTSSSAESTFVGSLPWGKREEELRAMLGIKKEPKDEESQGDNIPRFWPKSNQVSEECQTNRSSSSSSISSTVNSLTSGSNKSSSSRHVPVVSQLSLSRPQCSFVHIDGVQCGAVTWNKYCSYHQRVFNSEETNAHEQSPFSEGSQFARTDSSESSKSPRRIGRPGISQIFKPTTPPFDPPKRFGVDGRLDAISSVKTDQSLLSHNKNDRQLDGQKENGRDNEEIDLNSTVSYKALGAAGGTHRNIDLSTTVGGATRSLLLYGPSTDVTSEPRIDLSSTVPGLGRTLEPHGETLDSVKIDQGIDLSGTVPNLEELLALHGSSADRSSGPKFDPSKPVLKHGRSWNHQSSSEDRGPNIDLGATVPYRARSRHLSSSSVASDNAPSIDLNETVSQPGRSRTPLDTDLKDGPTANLERFVSQPATARDTIPHFKDDVSLKRPLTTRPHRESTSVSPTPNIKTEMIDLNFSTKLLGVPHSVVTPFNTSVPSPKKLTREITKSPSEFSSISSISASSRNYAPPSPQNRRVSTSLMAGEQSPASTVSLPNLSLDLSRFNLPPAVRKALAERYSGRKVPSVTSGQSAEFPEGRRSQPLFTDHTRNEAIPNEQGKKLSSLPARLRSRGQRSVSLDSPMIRKENLCGEDSPRSGLLERGNIYDANRFLCPPIRQTSEGHNQTGLSAPERVSEGFLTGSNNLPLASVPSTFKPVQDNSNELQSRGLIDLSSTSYLQGLSVPPSIQGRPTETTQTTIDDSRSPARPLVFQSGGLIDLNTTSTDFGSRDIALETPEAFSVVKRKRVNSFEGSETSSSLGSETLVKRLKQDEASARDTVVTYRSGINVQQLLTIERDEQDQLQNLHKVQSRLKSVRAQIQKLCTELDSLSSEEQRITLKMGELRNLRLSILENACYDRQEQVTRLETVTRESSTSTGDDSRTVPVSLGPVEGELVENDHRKVDTHRNSSSPPTHSRNVTPGATERNNHGTSRATERNVHVTSRATERNDHVTSRETECNDGYHAYDTEEEKMAIEFDDSSTSQGGVHSTEEPLSTSRSSVPMLESRVSVETVTKFVSRDRLLHNSQPREKEKLDVASKRDSYKEVDLNRGTSYVVQASRASISEKTTSKGLAAHQENEPSSFDGGSERRFASVPETFGGQGTQRQNDSSRGKETRKDFMKKMKNMHLLEKVSPRKKSFSDVNVSKTIEASRKKIQSTRENMKRWREQELGVDFLGSNEDQKKKHGSSSSTESIENSLEESGPSPVKTPARDKTSNRRTTKELKKSSLFHSGKKASKEARKNRVEKSHWKDKEKFKLAEVVPSKRRKIDSTLCNKPSGVPSKEKTFANEKAQVVSAAAHTTTTDLGGSGTEERSSAEDEIPTRDVDVQPGNTSSNTSHRASHLQIPSSTVESVKKNMQNSREGRQHRGPLPNKFSGHTGAVCGLKVHNGHLFTCSADKTTRSFNIQTGQCVKVFHGHHQGVNCVEVSVDKDRLFTGSNDQTVRSYNIKSGVCTHNFKLDGRVMCLHAAFDLLFVGLSTGVVASLDLLNNKCVERLHCHEPRGVSCLTTATEGQRKLLCSGSFDSTIAIRDCKSGLVLRTFSDHNMTVLCLQVVENILYSGSADMKVQAHNLNSGELLRSFDGHTMSVSGLQVVGSVLVTSCLDKLIRCYDLMTAELLQVYGGQMDMIFSVHVNNGRIYSGARDGSVVSSKLDLRVYHPCKWRECNLNFGVVSHLKNHIRDYHVMEQGTVEACHWADCGHQFSTDDDISVVLKHVLGHVVTRTARKSAT